MKKLCCLVFALLAVTYVAQAHVIAYEPDQMPGHKVFWKYLLAGYEHIIPLGLDHILFILCLFFLNTSLKQTILQASMFTLAHSITLALAMYKIIEPPASIIEPLIALSIVLLALENIFSGKIRPWRFLVVFIFGLVHGMGFAAALSSLGIPSHAFATALISFNVGVELGQLSIILFMYFCVAKLFSRKIWYRRRIIIPASLTIAFVAGYWTIERLFSIG